MSMNKFLEKYGTVKEYFVSFNTLFSKKGFYEWYLVDLFICGLPPDIEKGVSMFKPKTLSDAYTLAKLQESTHNFMIKKSNRPLLYSSKFDDSKEVVKTNMGSMDLDGSCKEDVKSKKIKHIVLNGFDELCKDEVKSSETELKVSEMNEKNKCMVVCDMLVKE